MYSGKPITEDEAERLWEIEMARREAKWEAEMSGDYYTEDGEYEEYEEEAYWEARMKSQFIDADEPKKPDLPIFDEGEGL